MRHAPGVEGSPPGAGRSEPAAEFAIRFADGGTLALGRRTAVLGVLNVTPDSFWEGSRSPLPSAALRAAARMVQAGADAIDVGGESTRPGAVPVDAEEETRRVVPVIEALKRELGVRVAIDTMKAAVARRAFDAGADMLNDVTALGDPEMLPLARERGVPLILMHMRGVPATMQEDTCYDDLPRAVAEFLDGRVRLALGGGIADDKILVDPGIGFGKSARGNLELLERLPALAGLGRPIVVGASRKAFVGAVLDLPVAERLEGSLAVAAFACSRGAHVIRTHDVEATVRAVRMVDAIRGA